MLTGWKLKISNLFLIPQRWVIGIMGFTGLGVAYLLRVCLNMCITQMVHPILDHDIDIDPDACEPRASSNNETIVMQHGQYDWDEEIQSFILGAFYYGYMLTHVPGGMLAEKYGAKHIFGFGILMTAIFTIATPPVIYYGGEYALIAIRVVEGLAEGATTPALAALMSRWVPKNERGRMGCLIFGGAQLGNIAGSGLSGLILTKEDSWPSVFYLFGGIGCVWFVFWTIFVYSDPNCHPFISDKEKEYLEIAVEKVTKKPIPWRHLLSSTPVWAIIIAAVGHDWGYFTMVTDLPKFMINVLKFDIGTVGMMTSLSYIVMWITSFIFAAMIDWIIQKERLSVKNARKLATVIATAGPSIFMVAAAYVGCDSYLSVAMITIAMTFMSAYYCGMKVNALDITPNFAGTATALINGCGVVSGILTPYIVAIIAPQQTKTQWQTVFWIVFGVMWITGGIYVIFAQGEVLWWNDIDMNNTEQTIDVSIETESKNNRKSSDVDS